MAHVDLFSVYRIMLCDRLHYFLADLHPILRADVVCALEAPGKLFAQPRSDSDPVCFWSLLVLLIALHVSPDIDLCIASSVAVAVECLICAGDMFDDIEDGDFTPVIQNLGTARTLSVSSSLCFLSQKAIISLSTCGVSSNIIIELMNAFVAGSLNASVGQHQDLMAEKASFKNFSQEKCLEIIEGKSGTLVKLACQLGAMCANADEEMYQSFSSFGNFLGIADQLDNDIYSLYGFLHHSNSVDLPDIVKSDKKSLKSDLLRRKKTLPIVLAVQSDKSLQETFLSNVDMNKEIHRKAIYEGIVTSRAISLLYRERARECLQVIEARQSISLALRTLLKL